MMKYIAIVMMAFPALLTAQAPALWNLYIQSDMGEWLPARISFEQIDGETYLNVHNAEEKIQLKPTKDSGDTTYYNFIDYNAEIAFTPGKENTYTGYWVNYESSAAKERPIFAERQEEVNSTGKRVYKLAGKWRATVKTETHSYGAMILFEQDDDKIHGTIRTNSGDYRYMEGMVSGKDFYMTSFTGRSIFRLSGSIVNDTLVGRMNSETTNSLEISAVKDETFELPESTSLTKVVNDKPFQLDLKDEMGVEWKFAELIEGKVSIVSIFGTWCPNCIDETNYLQELQKKFPDIEIVLVAFEATDNVAEQQRRVKGFKERKDVDFHTLIAGKLGKENVMEKFPMMGSFGGYPTTFLLDKTGKIVEVHTGFNGPATGMLYDQFVESQERKIKSLLAE